MNEPNRILVKMLERLRSGLLVGPAMNCRPHKSRQRVDVKEFEKLAIGSAAKLVRDVLALERAAPVAVKFAARTNETGGPKRSESAAGDSASTPGQSSDSAAPETGDVNACEPTPREPNGTKRRNSDGCNDPYLQQQALLHKLKVLTEDTRMYEQDTGVDVLHIGFPLLQIPPGRGRNNATKGRVLAPLALIPVTLSLKMRPVPTIEMGCRGDEVGRVLPNPSLFAWLEQSGFRAPDALFEDDRGLDPWREISELTRWVAETFGVQLPELFASCTLPDLKAFDLVAAPRADATTEPCIIPAAVLGLFPVNNQALLRDMEAMVAGESLDGPVRSFIEAGTTLDAVTHEYTTVREFDGAAPARSPDDYLAANDRQVSPADPCQARAVRLARAAAGLVVHGPPGTGKSQTITNILGDHLMRGQRVLVVSDKRTALDVVADRLGHLGLGALVAVVHDPGRDQRELYRSLREQLENLADTRTDSTAEKQLARIDRELDGIRQELTAAWGQLHTSEDEDEPNFHELMGRWLNAEPEGVASTVYARLAQGAVATRGELEADGRGLRDVFNKADRVQFATSRWSQCAGLSLDDFLRWTGQEIRDSLHKCIGAATEADAAAETTIPSFLSEMALSDQVAARSEISNAITALLNRADEAVVTHWLQADDDDRKRAHGRLEQAATIEQIFRRESLDVELWCQWGELLPEPAHLARQIDTLGRSLRATGIWQSIVYFRWRRQADKLLHAYGLPGGRPSAERLHSFLKSCQARRSLRTLLASLVGRTLQPSNAGMDDDRVVEVTLDTHHQMLETLCKTAENCLLEPLRALIVPALGDSAQGERLADGLRKSAVRAEKIAQLEAELRNASLFRDVWLQQVHEHLCQGKRLAGVLQHLFDTLSECETVVRINEAVGKLPSGLRAATNELLRKGITADQSLDVLDKLANEHAIRMRLALSPGLARLDGQRLTHNIQRYRELRAAKHEMVCAAILHRWSESQKRRLLASTRSRLSSAGADVRRRFSIQGSRSMRLRKVIEVGASIEEGDPLFDLRPIWMASPETVAQIFPRLPLFDVIVFDEASQCRLEEALPALTRGRRVVIAGDTKQLPPTRFFETAVVSSEGDDAETEQQWFELQQGEVEDLLAGALNLQIEQCYLDVHYRSRNADLISFSNECFYASRLQPIPGHPRNRTRFAPITLYHAGGVYEERTNRIEAEKVCFIVRDLLRRAEPPSIGIACFNTDQRDLIVDCLDDLAGQDADFANRLAEARSRKGIGASEALFVKNLENVQGDERDHLVISTTYGPNREGRFYRRFGPLGRIGGGRRLNVLVTRAKHEVHLVTSIPPAVFRSVPPLLQGQSPNGAWLLFSYLAHAEQLAALYAEANAALDSRDRADESAPAPTLEATTQVCPAAAPSSFAEAFARTLAEKHHLRSLVYWGNDGFCVDVAVGHPNYVEDVTIGILCDLNRYERAEDPIEWEIFRTEVLEATGWQLERIWTPQFFRDPTSVAQMVSESVADFLASDDVKNALRVES